MKTAFTQKRIHMAAACALALGFMSGTVGAQAPAPVDQRALVVDTSGQAWKSSDGECVRNAFGPAPLPNLACGPQPLAQYVAPAPDPAPVVVAAASAEQVRFDANVLFDSGAATLRPAGRDELDRFVSDIRGLDSENVLAVGYADRMGTDASNQQLSRQRVDAVKAYLVGKGIAAGRVQTRAEGETLPTTLRGECRDAGNAANVACMQPDRHVSIEVSGTRVAR